MMIRCDRDKLCATFAGDHPIRQGPSRSFDAVGGQRIRGTNDLLKVQQRESQNPNPPASTAGEHRPSLRLLSPWAFIALATAWFSRPASGLGTGLGLSRGLARLRAER